MKDLKKSRIKRKVEGPKVEVPMVGKPIKDLDVTIVMDSDGKVRKYNVATGEAIDEVKLKTFPIEVFNEDKANIFFYILSQGTSFKKALRDSKISYKSFVYWRKTNLEFGNLVDKAREMRSEMLHEEFYSSNIELLLTEVDDLKNKEGESLSLTEVKSRIDILEKRQRILSKFKEEDAPTRFGVKYSKQSNRVEGSFSFEATVPEKVLELIEENFTPILNEEGEIVLPNKESKHNVS